MSNLIAAPARTCREPQAAAHDPDIVAALQTLDARLCWLSAWIIHHANHLRASRDKLKVGGHQASCASITTIMATLYFHALRAHDRVAVKPHASPVLHAIHYMLGNQTRDQLERFRGLGGAQSYPSRTKDAIPVDFSTGSVGLGVAVTAFASLVQDYLMSHGHLDPAQAGRMIALLGDAELDEGNIYECLIEACKQDIRNCWWIVDYNRQSLDATTTDRMFRRFDDIFETCGWRVLTLKYGRMLRDAFQRPGGGKLEQWIDSCSNADYAALTYQGGAAWRARLIADIGGQIADILASFDDDGLARLMTNLGGHCVETLLDAYAQADDEHPTLFIAYTIKGFNLPFAGHKDNHAGIMTASQIDVLRERMGIPSGEEWSPFAGLGENAATALKAFMETSTFARTEHGNAASTVIPVPENFPVPAGKEQSTQAAFGRILFDLAKNGGPLADRIVTASPDVTVSTNLGAFVSQRGLFRRQALDDAFQHAKIPSAQKWFARPAGQHIELGIAENNLFLLMAALGLSAPLFGTRLLPIGTVYDTFIARGLDALNYGCYQDARFLLVATPSGVTLGPEGGAHQSIHTPLIGMGQPNLTYFEPAFADELAAILRWSFEHLQAADGGSVYLRLSTRVIPQFEREDDDWHAGALAGGYWLKRPAGNAPCAIIFTGALAPEVQVAYDQLVRTMPGLGVLNVTSPDLLHRGWTARRRARGHAVAPSQVDQLLGALNPDARLITIIDGSPSALSWLGSVRGQPVYPLGVEIFGQTGDLPDLYRTYRLDADAILGAAAEFFPSA